MSDEGTELEPERRAPRSRADERRFTWIGVGLAVVGGVVVLAPVLATNDIGVVPAVVGLAFVGCGCTMIVPGVFVPFLTPIVQGIRDRIGKGA